MHAYCQIMTFRAAKHTVMNSLYLDVTLKNRAMCPAKVLSRCLFTLGANERVKR